MAKAAAFQHGALQYAASQEETEWLEVLKVLLKAGIPVDKPDCEGRSALHWACYNGRLQSVVLLLQRKADPNLRDRNGLTPLLHIAQSSCSRTGSGVAAQVEITKHLLDSGADVAAASTSGFTALSKAARVGNTKLVRLLLDRGAPVSSGKPLVKAATKGHAAVARLLQERAPACQGSIFSSCSSWCWRMPRWGAGACCACWLRPMHAGCCSPA